MKRPVSALAALLVAQLLLAAGLAVAARRPGGVADAPFLSFDRQAIDRVVIEGAGGARAELARSGGAWKVASLGGFPAEAGKVERLLGRLAGLRGGDLVATSAEAATRFQVADGHFERRVTLEAGSKKVATALFGTAAAMRSVHARAAGSGEVRLVEFSAWEAPATAGDWIDKTVLRVPVGEIEAIQADGVTLERVPAPAAPVAPASGPAASTPTAAAASTPATGPTWRATGLPKGASLDAAAAEALVTAVADLSIAGLAGAEPQGGWGLEHPALVLRVRRSGGGTVEYRLAEPADGTDWILQASSRPERFRLASYAAEALRKAADAGTLSGHPPAAPAAAAARAPARRH